jgi:hypothetical protein
VKTAARLTPEKGLPESNITIIGQSDPGRSARMCFVLGMDVPRLILDD